MQTENITQNPEESLKVYVFNVGAGDNIMLQFPDGSLGIIDSFFTKALNLDEPPALTYLKHLRSISNGNPIRISFLAISHADIDHLKGVEKIIEFIEDDNNNVVLDNLWLFGGVEIKKYQEEFALLSNQILNNLNGEQREEFVYSKSRYEKLIQCLSDFTDRRLKKGFETTFFDDFKPITPYGEKNTGVEYYSFGPLASFVRNSTDRNISSIISHLFEKTQEFRNSMADVDFIYKGKIDRNSISSILSIVIKDYKLIFGGDATKEVIIASLEDIPKRGGEVDYKEKLFNPDFIKAAHHGARTSTSVELWQKLLPNPSEKLFIAVSAGLSHGHPHRELFEDLNDYIENKNIDLNIYTTNRCESCIKKDVSIKGHMQLHWLDETQKIVDDPRVLEKLSEEEPESLKLEKNNNNFAAYIFDFSLGNKKIDVYKGLSTKTIGYHKCSFDIGCTSILENITGVDH